MSTFSWNEEEGKLVEIMGDLEIDVRCEYTPDEIAALEKIMENCFSSVDSRKSYPSKYSGILKLLESIYYRIYSEFLNWKLNFRIWWYK